MTTLAATPRTLLRAALAVDAAVTGLNGLAYVAAAGALEPLLGLPAAPLRWAGAFLLVFAAAVAVLATRPAPPRGPVTGVIIVNLAWVVGSLAVVAAAETLVGQLWIVAQALVVGAFAAVQGHALRAR